VKSTATVKTTAEATSHPAFEAAAHAAEPARVHRCAEAGVAAERVLGYYAAMIKPVERAEMASRRRVWRGESPISAVIEWLASLVVAATTKTTLMTSKASIGTKPVPMVYEGVAP
jgi:hypothetical protein